MEIGALANGTAAPATQRQGIAQDFDTFLTLLTTQLQNQDPLEPTDSNEFTRQLVAFAGVEQQIVANEKLENLAALTAFNQTLAAVGYLGKVATVPGDTGFHDGASGISFEYELPRTSSDTEIRILDEDGNTVFSGAGETKFGIHRFDWPGTDAAGNPFPAGNYRIDIRAEDENNSAIAADLFVREPVTEVETSGAVPILTVGGRKLPLNDILAVSTER
ncbi:MAG: flagellar hook capping FlgD N-terminal domain-containing protein [Rhodothalassiaceae bacterium]